LVTENIENSEEYQKAFSGAKVYIVGTAHFSNESREDVIRTISQTQPDFVMVELCSSRISILSMNEEELLREASSLNRQKIMAIIKQVALISNRLH
jgi:pheromone shutdown protein TraB